MAYSLLSNVTIRAVSTIVAPDKVSILDELQYFSNNVENALRFSAGSGLHTRRVADDSITASDMCIQAARNLLAQTDTCPAEIDALLFVSHSPDYLLPATASIQQHALGLSESCATMDLNVGCTGFVQGLWMASSLIASQACKNVLLLVGDTPARFQSPRNRVTAPVFGDAGTATLLQYSCGSSLSFALGSNGAKHTSLIVPGGGARIPFLRQEQDTFSTEVTDYAGNPWTLGEYCSIWMKAMDIYSFGISVVPPHLTSHLTEEQLTCADIDKLFLHQANKVIIDAIAKKIGIHEDRRVPREVLGRYGNLGAASIPALLCEHYAGHSDETITRETPQHQKSMLCAFGAGFTWASCIVSLRDTIFLPVQDYQKSENSLSRDEHIAVWHTTFANNKR